MMRFEGVVKSWNADKGFGFITPSAGGQDIFLHASQLGQGGPPTLNERLSFEIALNTEGKKRAVRVQRLTAAASREAEALRPPSRSRPAPRLSRTPHAAGGGLKALVALGLVLVLGWQGYTRFVPAPAGAPAVVEAVTEPAPPLATQPDPLWQPQAGSARTPVTPLLSRSSPSAFSCDGRQHCSQMRSCEEASYFLKNCPNTRMDGDGDGVPCEQQLCR